MPSHITSAFYWSKYVLFSAHHTAFPKLILLLQIVIIKFIFVLRKRHKTVQSLPISSEVILVNIIAIIVVGFLDLWKCHSIEYYSWLHFVGLYIAHTAHCIICFEWFLVFMQPEFRMKSSIVIAFGCGFRKEEEKNVQEKCQSNAQCNGTIDIVPNDSLSYFCSMTIWFSTHHTFGQTKTEETHESK